MDVFQFRELPPLLKPDGYKLQIQEMQCLNFQLSEISELMQFGFAQHLLDVSNCRKTLCSFHFSQSLNSNSQSMKTATELCTKRRISHYFAFPNRLHNLNDFICPQKLHSTAIYIIA